MALNRFDAKLAANYVGHIHHTSPFKNVRFEQVSKRGWVTDMATFTSKVRSEPPPGQQQTRRIVAARPQSRSELSDWERKDRDQRQDAGAYAGKEWTRGEGETALT